MVRAPPIGSLARPANRSIAHCRWRMTWTNWKTLARLVEQSGIVFMSGIRPALLSCDLRLKELLATQLGPRALVGHTRLYGFDRYAMPGPTTQIAPAPFDRSRQLSARLVLLRLPGAPDTLQGFRCQVIPSRTRGARVGLREFRRDFRRGATAQISYGRYHGRPGARPAASCRRRAFRSSPSAARPGSKCPRRSSGPIAAGTKEERLGQWSLPSATCSTISSTALSGAITPADHPRGYRTQPGSWTTCTCNAASVRLSPAARHEG